jgi:hypothetical protein
MKDADNRRLTVLDVFCKWKTNSFINQHPQLYNWQMIENVIH